MKASSTACVHMIDYKFGCCLAMHVQAVFYAILALLAYLLLSIKLGDRKVSTGHKLENPHH